MEDILNYENRDQLYSFLIDNFGLIKTDEHYNPKAFGNFYIVLSAKDFLFSYVNDRSFLTINIVSKLEPTKGLALSFVKDFLYNPDNINSEDGKDNSARIEDLNNFIKKDFLQISQLFSPENYYNTRKQIDELLIKKFDSRYPGLRIKTEGS